MENKNKVETWPGEFIHFSEKQDKKAHLLDILASYSYYIEEVRERCQQKKTKHEFSKHDSQTAFDLYQWAGQKLITAEGEEEMSTKEFILTYIVPLFDDENE